MKRKIPEPLSSPERRRLIERPKGYFWEDTETGETFGPFATVEEAMADSEDQGDETIGPIESIEEAEDELGIASWIDPDTGELAEESVPRLEDH
jgi:hypothetical protein